MKIRPAQDLNRRELVVRQLLQLIQSSELAPGSRLPTEAELSDSFQVSRTVIREAMKSLQAMGVVSIEQGRGTFVTQAPLAQPFSLWASINLHRLDEVFEVRKFLEAETAARAAVHATPADLEALALAHQEYLDALEAKDHERATAADRDLHLTIASSTGLPLLAEMVEVTVPIWTSMSPNFDIERVRKAYEEHTVVLAAIRARDEQAARIAMVIHIEHAYQRLHEATRQQEEEERTAEGKRSSRTRKDRT